MLVFMPATYLSCRFLQTLPTVKRSAVEQMKAVYLCASLKIVSKDIGVRWLIVGAAEYVVGQVH